MVGRWLSPSLVTPRRLLSLLLSSGCRVHTFEERKFSVYYTRFTKRRLINGGGNKVLKSSALPPLPYWLKRIRKGWGGRAVCWIFPALLLIDDQRSLFPPKISSFLWIFLEGGWQWGGQLPVCISSVVYRLCSKTFFSKKTLKYCIEFRVSLIDEYLTTSIYSSITTR